MAYEVSLHPKAVQEARAARQWYQARSPRAAAAFVRELDVAVKVIAETPGRWPAHDENTRRVVMRRFPFAVVFRVSDDIVWVVAVAHARRRPGYWRGRTFDGSD